MKHLPHKLDRVRTSEDFKHVYQELKDKALNGERLTEHEKNFFCSAIDIVHGEEYSSYDFEVCKVPRFKDLYKIYFADLTGGSKYYKFDRKDYKREVPPDEAQKDLNFLINEAKLWENIFNHRTPGFDVVLDEIYNEFKIEIKALNRSLGIKHDPTIMKGKFYYKYRKWGGLLRFKYFYHVIHEIYEIDQPFNLTLSGNNFEITTNSLIHILNRHFAQIDKQYESGKSFHIDHIDPRLIGQELQGFFDLFEPHLPSSFNPKEIDFTYNGITYRLVSDFVDYDVGISNWRVITFYPVSDSKKLSKIKAQEEVEIDKDLSLWINE